jgi:Putative Flp pilus-assembly TadE/G-like
MNTSRYSDERGAITIHVAIALIAMLAFVSFVADYGLMWVSRRQAQNAADAGALAGAIALVHEGNNASAKRSAAQLVSENYVFGTANDVTPVTGNVDIDVSGTGPGEKDLPPCGTTQGCVRVDIMRGLPGRPENGTAPRGDVLPTFFGKIVGVTSQAVRATATAQTANGNSIRCLLPFAVIDRWADNTDPTPDPTYFANDGLTGTAGWTPNDKFEPPSVVDKKGNPLGNDSYVAPYNNNPAHTGWRVKGPNNDYGRQLILKDGSPGNYSAGWANEVDLPNSTGSQDYKWNIEHCNPQGIGIATESDVCSAVNWTVGCVSVKTGVSQGPTSSGIGDFTKGLVGQDAAARWDPTITGVGPNGTMGAVVNGSGVVSMSTPRIRPIVIIDINNYISQGCSGTTCIAKVANIIGFFVEGMCADVTLDRGLACDSPTKDVVGRIVTLPGSLASGVGTVDDSASFIKVVRLVR